MVTTISIKKCVRRLGQGRARGGRAEVRVEGLPAGGRGERRRRAEAGGRADGRGAEWRAKGGGSSSIESIICSFEWGAERSSGFSLVSSFGLVDVSIDPPDSSDSSLSLSSSPSSLAKTVRSCSLTSAGWACCGGPPWMYAPN